MRYQHLPRAGVRLLYQRLLVLRRRSYQLLRHRSVWIVGTCCTRPWHQGACVRSEQLATVPSWTVCLSCSPATLSCRDLLHSAPDSGRLCQVRAAHHCSFLVSVLELLTGNLPMLGSKKQRVVKVVMDVWLATAGLRGGQILEACSCTSSPATLFSPLPPLLPRVQ